MKIGNVLIIWKPNWETTVSKLNRREISLLTTDSTSSSKQKPSLSKNHRYLFMRHKLWVIIYDLLFMSYWNRLVKSFLVHLGFHCILQPIFFSMQSKIKYFTQFSNGLSVFFNPFNEFVFENDPLVSFVHGIQSY